MPPCRPSFRGSSAKCIQTSASGHSIVISPWKTTSGPQPGEQQRRELVAGVFANDLANFDVPRGAALDDVYDACAAAWTAGRIASRTAERLPPDPDLDSTGLRMEIVY